MRDEDEERVRHLLRAACDRDLVLAHRVEYADWSFAGAG